MFRNYYLIHFIRKISPANSRIAEAIGETAIANNHRKLLVNMQVTAMVSFLEASSNLIYIVILVIIVRTSYSTLLQLITCYMIILPYAFLMNTSHNKNRVIEYGWKNVFMNLIIKGNNSEVIQLQNNQENKCWIVYIDKPQNSFGFCPSPKKPNRLRKNC